MAMSTRLPTIIGFPPPVVNTHGESLNHGESHRGLRSQYRGDVDHSRQDEAEGAQHLGETDQFDGRLGEVLGPSHHLDETLMGASQLHEAGGQETAARSPWAIQEQCS